MERRLSVFYDRIAYPAVTNVRLTFPGASAYDIYPRELHELYRGEQVLVVGRYRGEGPARVVLEGRVGAEATSRSFGFDVSFPPHELRNDFVPRVWAVRKVGSLLEEIRLNGERPELRDEVTTLARRFGLVTPYTSFLVAPDEEMRVARPTPTSPTITLDGRVQLQLESQSIEGNLRRPPEAPAEPAPRARTEAGRFAGFDSTVVAPSADPPVSGGQGATSTGSARGSAPSQPSPSVAPSGATGERGRRISEELREMENAERADDATSRGTRFVMGRAFQYRDGGYVDPNFRSTMRVIHIRALSRAYFAILARRPELRQAFAVGERVTVALDATRAIVIEPSAPDVSESDATRFVE
jgi:Ca-activated chloride channel family protein